MCARFVNKTSVLCTCGPFSRSKRRPNQALHEYHGYRRVVLLYQGELYPEAFVDFVHRRDAAKCVNRWAKPTKIYRAREKFPGKGFIKWAVGVIAHSYNAPMSDEDWVRAWKERNQIERGELPMKSLPLVGSVLLFERKKNVEYRGDALKTFHRNTLQLVDRRSGNHETSGTLV
jgi:hypothetical protein